MLEELRAEFATRFGRPARAAARAPGRVNLIGEHTDYNDGWVLPCAIDRDTWVLLAERTDGCFRLVSRQQPRPLSFTLDDPVRAGDWGDYARGVLAALREAGHRPSGADVVVASDVPPGAGLSSSAALCVALVTAFDAALELGLDPLARARLAHRAESHFTGIPCGVMDAWASALGRPGAALRIDCRSLETATAPLPPEQLRLLVAHSGVERRLADGRYAERRRECEAACERARRAGVAPDARALRDLRESDLPALERALPDRLFRRARHVIRENARVAAVFAALHAGDAAQAGARLREGMQSLREDFEVSTPELDALCEIGDAAPGVYGSRLTGAGFGGCTLHLVQAARVGDAQRAIALGFERRFGRRPPIHEVRAGPGACSLDADLSG